MLERVTASGLTPMFWPWGCLLLGGNIGAIPTPHDSNRHTQWPAVQASSPPLVWGASCLMGVKPLVQSNHGVTECGVCLQSKHQWSRNPHILVKLKTIPLTTVAEGFKCTDTHSRMLAATHTHTHTPFSTIQRLTLSQQRMTHTVYKMGHYKAKFPNCFFAVYPFMLYWTTINFIMYCRMRNKVWRFVRVA